MKKHIRTMTAALVSACLFVAMAPHQLRGTCLGWINRDAPASQHVSYFCFYIEKRQWLADVRTIAAAIAYLYETRASEATIPMTPPIPFPERNQPPPPEKTKK
jgi:hypothetical protein